MEILKRKDVRAIMAAIVVGSVTVCCGGGWSGGGIKKCATYKDTPYQVCVSVEKTDDGAELDAGASNPDGSITFEAGKCECEEEDGGLALCLCQGSEHMSLTVEDNAR